MQRIGLTTSSSGLPQELDENLWFWIGYAHAEYCFLQLGEGVPGLDIEPLFLFLVMPSKMRRGAIAFLSYI